MPAEGVIYYPDAVTRLLRESARWRHEVGRVAEAAATYARSIAPDAPPLKAGYIAGLVGGVAFDKHEIPIGRVAAKDHKSIWIERGTGGASPTPAFHVLSRALFHARGG